MKTLIAALLLSLPLVAQAKKNDPPVYNLTGTVTQWLATYDTTASVTVNGKTSFAGCNTSDTNIDCSDVTGGYTVKLADGHTYVLSRLPSAFRVGLYGGEDWYNVAPPSLMVDKLSFQYRLVTLTGKNDIMAGSYFCVASPTVLKFKQHEEICYTMSALLK
jgi:hypothetical protein